MKVEPNTCDWRPCTLGDILRRHNEIIHPGDRADGEAVFVGLEHIESNTGRRIGSLKIDLGRLTGRKPTFRAGQIVYGYLRPYLNKVWVAEFDGCSSVDQFAFEVNGELADTEFIAAFMRSETFLRRSSVVTTTGQLPRISIDEILAVEIDLPPLVEQERIAAALTAALAAVDRARRAAQDRLAAAEALPAAYLREVFEGPESSAWETIRLGDSCDLLPSKSIATTGDTEVRAITTACLSEVGFLPRGIKTARMHGADVRECFVKPGEVLVARSNTPELVGRVAMYQGDPPGVVASDLTIRVWPRDGLSPNYLTAFLSYLYLTGYWRERAGGASGSMKKITREQLLGQPGGGLELAGEVVGAQAGDRCHLLQRRVGVEVALDVLDHGPHPRPRQGAVPSVRRSAGGQDVPKQAHGQDGAERRDRQPPAGAAGRQLVAHRRHRGADGRDVQADQRWDRQPGGVEAELLGGHAPDQPGLQVDVEQVAATAAMPLDRGAGRYHRDRSGEGRDVPLHPVVGQVQLFRWPDVEDEPMVGQGGLVEFRGVRGAIPGRLQARPPQPVARRGHLSRDDLEPV
jgi:type I restriction enzyme S subunit